MNSPATPLILSVDDDEDILRLTGTFLRNTGYNVMSANSAQNAMEVISNNNPDVILLDVVMPGMNGYEFCARLQANKDTAYIPVIFVTALEEEEDKARAFAVGAVDYLVKPIKKDVLITKVEKQIRTNARWKELSQSSLPLIDLIPPSHFPKFKEFLSDHLDLAPEEKEKLLAINPSRIYSCASEIGITKAHMAQYIAGFLRLRYLPFIDPEHIRLGILPAPFCLAKTVVTIGEDRGNTVIVVSNPFDWELLDVLDRSTGEECLPQPSVTEPANVLSLFGQRRKVTDEEPLSDILVSADKDRPARGVGISDGSESEIQKRPVVHITRKILHKAVMERASDIHVEPKATDTVIRFRIDGDMRDVLTMKRLTSAKLISHLKAIGDMDITQKRRPQDGTLEIVLDNRTFKLRLATTSTPDGESLVIRILEPETKPKDLGALGMTDAQSKTLVDFANRTQGFILVVGPTGSGKTTTLYGLLNHIDCKTRSLISVEDPVEYRIPFANQQQVNERAGVTFDSLLKSVVRQDPDVLFLGEIRDEYSARSAINFASTGHLTLSSLHTPNSVTAVFRLERLGIERTLMADALLGVVAQRLVRKLCPHCREKVDISRQEIDMLSPFTDDVPSQVAHPVGCLKCDDLGYRGREGVYEILTLDPDICEMVRSDTPVLEIRAFVRRRGDFLISHHAVEKVRALICSPQDVYEKVLVEEPTIQEERPKDVPVGTGSSGTRTATRGHILVIDAQEEIRMLVRDLLAGMGYKVALAEDSVGALLQMGKGSFDLIISEVNMPDLDGFSLLETLRQKGLKIPVVFLTSRIGARDEAKGLKLGALDYIKKPVEKEALLLRIERILGRHIP